MIRRSQYPKNWGQVSQAEELQGTELLQPLGVETTLSIKKRAVGAKVRDEGIAWSLEPRGSL